MTPFVRPPSSDELNKFKKSLNTWSEKKAGSLESKLGDRIKIESSQSCEVYSIAIDTLIEDRTTEAQSAPAKRDHLNTTPTVTHNSVNVWSKATPAFLGEQFQESTHSEEIPGTEYYSACTPCNEQGHTDCTGCNKTGKLICGQCNGTKKHDCHDCNGYGSFDCTACDRGMVETFCSTCDRGKIACDGCGGKGSHWSLREAKGSDCHLCNGSGKRTCLVCGGSDTETVRCDRCNNGSVPCQTCRTQKVVHCSSCDSKGQVNCGTCHGKSVLACASCQTQGGFRNVELLVYKAAIETNQSILSPIENVLDKIRLAFKDQVTLTEPRIQLDQIKSNVAKPELMGAIEQIHSHVAQNRPNSTLLERFELKKTTVLDVSFKYEDSLGHAFFDMTSGLMYVDVNPLEGKISSSHEKLKTEFRTAKSKEDISGARKLIEKAQGLKLADLAKTWNFEIDALEKQVHTREATAYRKSVMLPTFLGLGPLTWIAAGFLTPLSLTTLIIFSFVGIAESDTSSLKLEDGKSAHQKLFRTKIIRMSLIFLAVILIGLTMQYFGVQSATDTTFERGAPLSGEAS